MHISAARTIPMARLFPTTRDTSSVDSGPRVIGLESEDADTLLAAVSSRTARDLLAALHQSPAAPSELSNTVDSSLQNVQYHLNRLDDAGVIEVIDTVYSEKGREMNVYAPTDNPLVVVAGAEEQTTTLRSALTSLLGGLGIVGILAIAVQAVFDEFVQRPAGVSDDSGSGGAVIMEASRAAPEATTLIPPGVLFFAGGAVALTVVFIAWYIRAPTDAE